MGLNKSLNKLEAMMDSSTLITVLWTVHRRLERQRRDTNTLDKRFNHFKTSIQESGTHNTKAINNPKAMMDITRWQQAMTDVSESPFAKDVGRHVLARELLRQREAEDDSNMKEMKAMKVAKMAFSVAINATGVMKAMKATTTTKAMKATKQLPKKETEEAASSGTDSSSDSSSDSD